MDLQQDFSQLFLIPILAPGCAGPSTGTALGAPAAAESTKNHLSSFVCSRGSPGVAIGADWQPWHRAACARGG